MAVVVAACGGGPPLGDEDTGESSTASSSGGDASADDRSEDDDDTAPTTVDDSAGTDDADDTLGDADTTGDPPAGSARYSEVRQVSAHNAFQRHEALFDMLVWHRVRSIELDIHVGKTFESTIDGEWYVYHTDVTDDETSCVHLSDCLGEVEVFAHGVPEHEVVTVWVDLKDPWDGAHGPVDLDARLADAFGERVFTPADLQARCPGAASVQAAALDPECGWPELVELRGRVVVVLTGGAGTLADYDGTEAFVAPDVADLAAMGEWPQTPFFNEGTEGLANAAEIAAAGGIVRVYGLDDEAAWNDGLAADVHHFGTDMVNGEQDPWSVTHDEDGWPFACRSGPEGRGDDEGEPACVPSGPEPGAIVGIDVDSGDAWSTADDAWLATIDRTDDPDGTWTGFVSTENSWVEEFAKGCLVARASVDADAPYFAVCRPADNGRLRTQVRASAGGSTSAVEADIVPGNTIDPQGVAFVRLRISAGGTCVAGDGSRDGASWVEIDAHCFATPLPVQGLLASSHDGGVVRLLFGDVRLDDGAAHAAGDFEGMALGGATAQVYDGTRP
jgi:hypothetical protein